LDQFRIADNNRILSNETEGRYRFAAASSSELVVPDYAAEAAVDRHFSAAIIDKAKLPELIHEKIDPRPGCADHLCQVFLTDPRNYSFGPALPAKMGQQHENPSQALLGGVEKLVDEIRFVSDAAGKQMNGEHFREFQLLMSVGTATICSSLARFAWWQMSMISRLYRPFKCCSQDCARTRCGFTVHAAEEKANATGVWRFLS
jgi:hypothetical protein